jgi:hypothetical protein
MESVTMKPEDALNRVFHELDVRVDPRVDQRILQDTLHRLKESTETPPAGLRPMRWRTIMRYPVAKLAIAAAVVAAALLGIHFFSGTSGTSWAAVLDKVNGFDTCVYRTRDVETTGPRPDGFEFATEKEHKNYRSETYGCFRETNENGKLTEQQYLLLQEKQHVALFSGHPPGLCLRSPLDDGALHAFYTENPARLVAKILGGAYVEIGTTVIEGRSVRGVELRDPNVLVQDGQKAPPLDDFAAQFWIDVQTELPVWMELSFVMKGSLVRQTTIWDQFQWGVPLEASLFKPEIPTGYEVIDDDGSHKRPDTTPKNTTEEAFAQQTLAKPYLGDFDHLPLPNVGGLLLLGTDPTATKPQVRLLGGDQVRVALDACVAKWPPYEQVKDQLRQELQAKLNIDAKDVDELVTTGIAMRNLFWKLGGCLSDTAYPYIYAARLLDEIAHEKAPDNPAVIDQLLESIGSYEVLYYWDDPAPEEPRRNPIYTGIVADLCYQQWALLKARMTGDYTPTWKDFVRCSDIATASRVRKDQATNLEVIRLLIEQAPKAGWTTYLDDLKRGEQKLLAGEVYKGPGAFMGGIGDINLEQYARRLWSFQGPQEYRDQRVPFHLRHLKGW